jgi:hypothetical protein
MAPSESADDPFPDGCYIPPRALTSGEIATAVFMGLWAFVISVAAIVTSLIALGVSELRPSSSTGAASSRVT